VSESSLARPNLSILQWSDAILVDIYGLKKWWILNFTRKYGGFLQFDDVAELFVVEPTRNCGGFCNSL
jgi:hypothetical protein